MLLKDCKIISAAELVNFMEKEKSNLRKLKRVDARRKKQEETRTLNTQFQQDPGRVYSDLKRMVSEQENERPKYQAEGKDQQETEMFEDVDQAARFWRALWEDEETGETSFRWLADVMRAIENCVPELRNEGFSLDEEHCKESYHQETKLECPWAGQKNVDSLHKGVVRCLQEIGQGSSLYIPL